MRVVIDANVAKAYYDISVLGGACTVSADPTSIFDTLGSGKTAFADDSSVIEAEWRAVINDDTWFDAWLQTLLASGQLNLIPPKLDPGTAKSLNALGFPKGRDLVYVRTSHATASTDGASCYLVTEDVDFYDPTLKKQPKQRAKALASCKGPVATLLRKRCGVTVTTVAACP